MIPLAWSVDGVSMEYRLECKACIYIHGTMKPRRIYERILDLHVDSVQAAGFETANERKRVGRRAPNTLLDRSKRPWGTN